MTAPRKAPVFAERGCRWCAARFTPTSARQSRCDPCSLLTPEEAGRCPTCDATVSGRAVWGARWGGECDRSENRAACLMEKLGLPM